MSRVVLALGSNLHQRALFLERARLHIHREIGHITCASSVIERAAWGFQSTPFLNQVVMVDTTLQPEALLQVTQEIEQALGRTQKTQYDPNGNPIYHDRVIDIDILLYDSLTYHSPTLTIPHPQLTQREFVLTPLAELFGNQIIKPFNQSFQDLLKSL